MTYSEAYEMYEDFINESGDPIVILGLTYDPARVLKEVDPTAYRVYFNDYMDSSGIDTDDLTGFDPSS